MASNITSSSYISTLQADGRSQIHETHIDVLGASHALAYLADAGTDLSANLVSHAAQLSANLAVGEIDANIAQITTNGASAALTFNFSTGADLAGVFQPSVIASLTPTQILMAIQFLNAQQPFEAEALFGLTPDQLSKLASITPLSTQAEQALAIVGG